MTFTWKSLAVLACLAGPAFAQEGPHTLAENLDNPSGIAIHPDTGHIFISEHTGVVRLHSKNEKHVSAMEIAKYPTDIYGKGPKYEIGPLGVALLGNDQLIVGDGSRLDAAELVRVYKIGAVPLDTPQAEDAATVTLGPIGPGDDSAKGEGNFYAIAVAADAFYITSNGDDTKGWILKGEIKDGQATSLKPFIATKPQVEVDAPVGIALSPSGDLVVGQMGEVSVPGDSLLTIYDRTTGKLKANYATGLHDIAGLAYSAEGKLYGVDFAWSKPEDGGLFELKIEGDKCTARKVAALDKPTALAFQKNGSLVVTVFGTAQEGETTKPGKVLRFAKQQL